MPVRRSQRPARTSVTHEGWRHRPVSTSGGSARSFSLRPCWMRGATITRTRNGRRGPRAASRSEWSSWLCADRLGPFIARTERKRHRALDDDAAVDACDAPEHAHAAAQPADHGFDHDLIAGVHGAAVSYPLDSHEVDQFFAVLRLCQNHDRANLRHGFGQDRWRKHRRSARLVREIPLVQRDVLDADNPFVGIELGDAIDEQKWIAMRKNPFDRTVIKRQRQVHDPRCASAGAGWAKALRAV